MDNVFLNKIADCIGGGSTFDRADRLVMASKILAVLRPSGAAIEATSFQMLMDAYMRGYAWRAENPDSDEFLPKAAYDYSDRITGAPKEVTTQDLIASAVVESCRAWGIDDYEIAANEMGREATEALLAAGYNATLNPSPVVSAK